MAGRFICFVGPSGVGKDTVMAAYAAKSGATLAKRAITRPSSAGGEDFISLTDAEFDQHLNDGHFALHWSAHGLRYAIPNAVRDDLAAGHDVLANLSRAQLGAAQNAFPGTIIISLTAPPSVLAARLEARGRETAEDIERRLARGSLPLPDGVMATEIANGGALEDTLSQLASILETKK